MALFPFSSGATNRYRPMTMRKPGGAASTGSSNFAARLQYTWSTIYVAVTHLNRSTDPNVTFERLKKHKWTYRDGIYVMHVSLWIFWLSIMKAPVLLRIAIPLLYLTAIILPITSQFFFPALPILTWVMTFFTSRFIPVEYRPPISVSLLPTLESVLYGANISDILTRFTHPLLDIPAWLSYGVIHFVGPFVVAAFLWLFGARNSLPYWCSAFGYLNLTGVIIQILFPCAAPWYELRNGLTPADYSMPGSPGGLARIDAIFHSQAYSVTFSTAPVVFGAFPSLHAGSATMAVLFISHFWPWLRVYAWAYAGVLYWATMYLTHHYLIDVVAGACMATAFFYLLMPVHLRFPDNTTNTNYILVNGPNAAGGLPRNRYAEYDLDTPTPRGAMFTEDSLSDEDPDAPPNPLAPYGGHARRTSSPFPNNVISPRLSNFITTSSAASGKNHRHTASIASLIRAEERVDEGWSPVRKDFSFPPISQVQSGLSTPVAVMPPPIPSPRMKSEGLGAQTAMEEGGIARARSPSWPDKADE